MTNNSSSKKLQFSTKQERNSFYFSLWTFISTGLVSIYYFLPSTGIPFNFFAPNIQLGLLSFSGFIATLLAYKRRPKTAAILLIVGTNSALFMMTLRISGMDIMLAILGIIISFGVSSLILPPQEVRKVMYGSLSLTLLFLFLYFREPFERAPVEDTSGISWAITSIFLLAFLIIILRQFPSYPLRTKLTIAFLFLSSAIVAIAFILISTTMRNTLTTNAQENLLSNASVAAENINGFLTYSLNSVEIASAYIDIRSYLLLSPDKRKNSSTERQVQNFLFSLSNSSPDILSYGILDYQGNNVIDSDFANIGLNEAEQDYFTLPLNANEGYISPVLYLPNEEEGVLFFSAPIHNDMGILTGILRAKYRASVLQEILTNQKNIAGQEAFSVLFDSNHIILAHGSDPSLIGKIIYDPNTEETKNLRENFLFPSELPDTQISHDFKEIEEGLKNFVFTPYFTSEETELNEAVSGAVTQLEILPWLIISAQPNDIFLAPIQKQVQRILIAAFVLVLLAVPSSLVLANILVAPIIRLNKTAQKFLQGNLEAKAVVDTEDEIGSLAITLNNLASELGNTIETLEQRVAERTKDLDARTGYLEGAAEVTRTVASILDPNTLIDQIVELIKERFDLYYAGLFLVDEENKWALLKAGTGKAGQKMLSRQHKIPIGEGMIGWSIENEEARIALDVGKDAVQFKNPDLPETRSEGALPLRSRGRVLGALTVQSSEEAAFDDASITTLQTMADQVAVALDNAELFAKSEAALLAERKAYGQLSQASWRDLTSNQSASRFNISEDGKVSTNKKSDKNINLIKAIEKGQLLEDNNLTAIIPIKNREYILGGIRIRKSKGAEPWTQEELEITQAISEQISVALESARLFSETQHKAQREAIISEITAKIGESIQLDSILKTTAQELGNALDSPEVIFEIIDPPLSAK